MLGKRIKVGKLNAASGERMGLRIPGSGAIGAFGDNAMAKISISGSTNDIICVVGIFTVPSHSHVWQLGLLK
jgi:hypothetical protein